MSYSEYFAVTATVIPVLLVAGLLNPVMLREYSKTPSRARSAKRNILIALVATGVSVIAVALANVENAPEWLAAFFFVASSLIGLALGNTLLFIYFLAEHALDEDPHPDRFEFERRELERRQALLEAKRHLGASEDRRSNND